MNKKALKVERIVKALSEQVFKLAFHRNPIVTIRSRAQVVQKQSILFLLYLFSAPFRGATKKTNTLPLYLLLTKEMYLAAKQSSGIVFRSINN